MNKVALLLLALISTSCNLSLQHKPVTIKELLPVGSILRLTQTLVIPADRSFIYIAHGKVAPLKNYNTVNIYEPYCMFRLQKEAPMVRKVLADKFEVTKVVEWNRYYGSLDNNNLVRNNNRAGKLLKVGTSINFDSGIDIVMYATILRLHSDQQSEVKELVCGHWDEYSIVEPLTLEEMQSALGDLIIIESNAKSI